MKKIYSITIPAALLALIWISSVLGQWLELPALNIKLASMLNSMVGDSASFDLTMVFMTRDPGEILAAGLVFYLFCATLNKSFRFQAQSGRIIGNLLFLAGLTALTYELLDIFNSTIPSASPSELLPAFRDAMHIYNVEVDIHPTTDIISSQAVLIYLPVFLALLRTRQFLPLMLLLPMPFLLARMVVGIDWPGSALAGVLVAWLAAGLVTTGPLFLLYRKLEDGFDALWTSFVLAPGMSFYARSAESLVRSKTRQPTFTRGKQDSDYLKDHHRRHLLEQWGFEHPVADCPPYRNRIYKFEEAGQTYAFKICREHESADPERPCVLEMLKALREQGHAFTPALLKTRDGEVHSRLDGQLTYVMDWVEGNTLNLSKPANVESVTRLLAQFHGATEHLVEHDDLEPAEQFNIWSHRFRRNLARFEQLWNNPDLRGHWYLKQLNIEKRRSETMFSMASYFLLQDSRNSIPCMIHGDAHPLNYLQTAGGSIMMIDSERMRRGYGFEDLSALMRRYMARFRWDFESFRGALDAYLAVRPLPRQEIVLLLAEILYPRRYIKAFEKEIERPFSLQSQIRLLQNSLELRSTQRKRETFFIHAAVTYGMPFIGTIFDPDSADWESVPRVIGE